MNKKHLVATVGLLGLFAMTPIKAADFSYNYGQFTFDDVDVDLGVVSVDGDGFSLAGSFEISPDMFIEAHYGSWDFDGGVDGTGYEIGVGYHMPMNPKTDMVFGLSFGNIDFDGPGGSADSDIFAVSAGVRHQLDSKIELDAEVAYVDYDEGDSDFGFEIGAQYAFTKNVSGIISLGFGDDVDTLSFGARMYF